MAVDVEQLVSAYLRSVDLGIEDRVYTALPGDPTFPLVVVSSPIGALATSSNVRHHDRCFLQIDVYADRKKQAWTLSDAVLEALADLDFVGEHALGVVTGVEFIVRHRWLPDSAFTPAKPRYISDVIVGSHPLPSVVS